MKKNSFLLTLLGTVCSIVLTVLYTIIFSVVQNGVFSLKFGDNSAIAYLPYQTVFIVISFMIFEIIFFIWLFSYLSKDKENTLTSNKSNKKLSLPVKIAGGIGMIALVVMMIIGTNVYTEASKDGVRRNIFFPVEEYTWDDVYLCKLSCNETGALEYTIQFTDGTTIQILDNSNTCSNAFKEEFGQKILPFAVYLSDKFDESEIHTNVVGEDYLKQYYKKSESWDQIKKIGNIIEEEKSD